MPLLVAVACTTQVGSPEAPGVDAGGDKADEGFPDAGPSADAQPVFDGPCGEGDASIETGDGICFEYFFDGSDWDGARVKCQLLGGDLARADDASTNGIIASLVPGAFPDAWMRGTDEGFEGGWTWAGEPMGTYTNWRSGEPNNGNGSGPENCQVIESDTGGTWDDRACSDSFSYVCQR